MKHRGTEATECCEEKTLKQKRDARGHPYKFCLTCNRYRLGTEFRTAAAELLLQASDNAGVHLAHTAFT